MYNAMVEEKTEVQYIWKVGKGVGSDCCLKAVKILSIKYQIGKK